MSCYCGEKKDYKDCCEIFHKNGGITETAQQLMRSRYSAFVLANGDYLMATHHKSTRPIEEKVEIVNWAKSVTWIRLEILEATEKTVTFNALFLDRGQVDVIHEKSEFVKENNRWFYLGLSK